MKYQLRLLETVPDIVYHATNIANAFEILKSNKFLLTTQVGGSSDEMDVNKLYYLSTSDIKWGGYNFSFNLDNIVNIVLDGRKLSYTHKGIPVDYWGADYRRISLHNKNYDQFFHNEENEHRVYSNDPIISNAIKYIKEIHVCAGDLSITPKDEGFYTKLFNTPHWGVISKIVDFCKVYEIPCFIYLHSQAFKLLDKRRAFYVNDPNGKAIYSYSFIKALYKTYYGKALSSSEITYGEDIRRTLENYEFCINSNYELKKNPNIKQFISKLSIDIHNMKRNEYERKALDILLQILKRHKKSKILDLIKILYDTLVKRHGKNWIHYPYIPPYYVKD